jgi:hypothetical protein
MTFSLCLPLSDSTPSHHFHDNPLPLPQLRRHHSRQRHERRLGGEEEERTRSGVPPLGVRGAVRLPAVVCAPPPPTPDVVLDEYCADHDDRDGEVKGFMREVPIVGMGHSVGVRLQAVLCSDPRISRRCLSMGKRGRLIRSGPDGVGGAPRLHQLGRQVVDTGRGEFGRCGKEEEGGEETTAAAVGATKGPRRRLRRRAAR